jgi:hypothetical protein
MLIFQHRNVVFMVLVSTSRQMSWLSHETHNTCIVYSHSPTYDHPTHDQPKLRLKFPWEIFNSNYYKYVIKNSFGTTFELWAQSNMTIPVIGTTSIIILQKKGYVLESPSTCWRVHIPPHVVFSSYDQVFRMCPVCKLGSTCALQIFITIPSIYT